MTLSNIIPSSDHWLQNDYASGDAHCLLDGLRLAVTPDTYHTAEALLVQAIRDHCADILLPLPPYSPRTKTIIDWNNASTTTITDVLAVIVIFDSYWDVVPRPTLPFGTTMREVLPCYDQWCRNYACLGRRSLLCAIDSICINHQNRDNTVQRLAHAIRSNAAAYSHDYDAYDLIFKFNDDPYITWGMICRIISAFDEG